LATPPSLVPEAEFFIFDDVRFDQNEHSAYYYVDSVEGRWNTGRVEEGGNLGYKPRYKEGYFPVAPTDTSQDMRSEMLLAMDALGCPSRSITMRWRPAASASWAFALAN
jgi:glutamine synthetase